MSEKFQVCLILAIGITVCTTVIAIAKSVAVLADKVLD